LGHDGEAEVGIGDVTNWWAVAEVVPDEEAVPTRFFGHHGQLAHSSGVGQPIKGRQKQSVLHGSRPLWRQFDESAHP